MAKIAFTPVVGDARGKAGRSVFTRSRSGAVIRVRVKGKNPRTTAQSSVRNLMAAAARQFLAFTTEVAAWVTYANSITKHNAVSGQGYHPSAINAYIAVAVPYMLVNSGGTPPSSPPASPFTGDGETVTAVGASGKITFTASGANGTNTKMVLLAKALPSIHRAASLKSLKVEAYFAAATGALSHDVSLPPGDYAVGWCEILDTTGQMTPRVALDNVTVS